MDRWRREVYRRPQMAKCPKDACGGSLHILSLDPLVIRCESCKAILDIASDGSKSSRAMQDELAKIRTSLAKISKSLEDRSL